MTLEDNRNKRFKDSIVQKVRLIENPRMSTPFKEDGGQIELFFGVAI